MFAIINDAAQVYKDVIPADRWREPYMPLLVSEEDKNRLLATYWQIPRQQIETSVVLAYRRFSS